MVIHETDSRQKEKSGNSLMKETVSRKNADSRTRTSTWLPRVDFESTASTIPPHRHELCYEQ